MVITEPWYLAFLSPESSANSNSAPQALLGHRGGGEECCDWPEWHKLKAGLEPSQDAGINMPDYLGKVPGSLNDEKQ